MIRIAIDGPGGAGKSSIAKAVAAKLGGRRLNYYLSLIEDGDLVGKVEGEGQVVHYRDYALALLG